jgi:hypothetical protein
MAKAGDPPTVTRHVLSAEGPWTTPRLPAEPPGFWSLTPLNAALGSLLVFGDDELALEAAALGARAGLKVRLVTKRTKEDLMPVFSVGSFACSRIVDWAEVGSANLANIGLKPGVFVLVTAKEHDSFMPAIEAAPPGWLGLAGAATDKNGESGLFPAAVTPSQKAMGLLAAMLKEE